MPELLTNGGFEDNSTTPFGTNESGFISIQTTEKHGGTYAAAIAKSTMDLAALWSPAITVNPALSYTFIFYSKNNGTGSGRYGVWDYTNSANIIRNASAAAVAGSWTLVTYEFTPPAGCTEVQVYVKSDIAAGSVIYYDDLSLMGSATGRTQIIIVG